MFTRFRTATAVHVFDGPRIKFPPNASGASFLAALFGAYELEQDLYRQWLIRNAGELKATLEHPDFNSQARVSKFLVGLNSLIEFLHSLPEDSVAVYSSDRAPSPESM